jgi:hypothetical protein
MRLRLPLGSALVCLVAWAGAGCGKEETVPADLASMPSGAFDYRGLDHVSWWHDEYASAMGTTSRQALAGTGANWGAVLTTWYMRDRNATLIAPDPQRTPSEPAVRAAIRHMHELGLRVMLKPHVDVDDGTWRGSILPPDTASWFASYAEFLLTMARVAREEKVEVLCVGTELARLTGPEFRGPWAVILPRVREAYGGALTYAANAVNPADEFTSVSFWDLLDLGGLDVYAPLTDKDDPTRDELVRAWNRNREGHDMVASFRNWQRSHSKPVVFTEIGYRSVRGANRTPWEWGTSPPFDAAEQANCYAAAFEVWLRESSWMKGMFWWAWSVPRPPPGDTDYSPWGKPAEDELRRGFAAR